MDATPHPETILVVDDEDPIRRFVQAMLEHAGYKVLAADAARTGISLYEQHRSAVALLLTDVQMPGMSGLELASHVRSLEPRLPVLLMSATALKTNHGFGFVQKPFTHYELLRRTAEMLNSRQPSAEQPSD